MLYSQEKSRTFELLVQSAATCDAKCTNKLFEVDGPILVLVEYIEDIVSEFSRISEWEELFVYPTEFYLVKLTSRAVP